MTKPSIVPDRISNPINRGIILVVLIIGTVIFTAFQILPEKDTAMTAFVISVVVSSCTAVFAFLVSIQHRGGILAKAYFLLGLGFVSYVIGELLYYTFDLIFKIEPYPSIADIFFFALYPFVLGHMILSIKDFQSAYTQIQNIWIVVIPSFVLVVYTVMSLYVYDDVINFDFYYGAIFVAGASTVLAFTIRGALIFHQGVLGTVWLLLVIGLMLNAAADVWYYHMEISGEYYDAHPVTIVWYVANMFVIYGLYKHLKTV
jgi:hypothetical protein